MFDPGFNCRLNDSVGNAVTQVRTYIVFSATIATVAIPMGNTGANFIGRGPNSISMTQQGLVVGKHVLPQSVIDDLINALNQAQANVKPGAHYGTRLHAELAKRIVAIGRSDLHAEVSYVNGSAKGYGTSCSTRIDILYGTKQNPQFILDLKVGGARLNPGRNGHIRGQLPVQSQGIPIIEIHL